VRIAEFSESSNLRTQIALSGYSWEHASSRVKLTPLSLFWAMKTLSCGFHLSIESSPSGCSLDCAWACRHCCVYLSCLLLRATLTLGFVGNFQGTPHGPVWQTVSPGLEVCPASDLLESLLILRGSLVAGLVNASMCYCMEYVSIESLLSPKADLWNCQCVQ